MLKNIILMPVIVLFLIDVQSSQAQLNADASLSVSNSDTGNWYPALKSEEKIKAEDFFDEYIRNEYKSFSNAYDGLLADNIFINKNYGWKMLYLDCGAGQCGIALYKTTDGGKNWTVLGGDSGKINQTVVLGGHKTGISFRDENTGWIGVDIPAAVAELYMTRDGGNSWNSVELPLPENNDIYQTTSYAPSFFNENDGIAFAQIDGKNISTRMLIIFVTHDGGEKWIYSDKLISEDGNMKWDFSDYDPKQESFQPPIKGTVEITGVKYYISDKLLNWTTEKK